MNHKHLKMFILKQIGVIFLILLTSFSFAQVNPDQPIEVLFTKKDSLNKSLLEYLDHAQISIYAALYDINYQDFADKIIEKKRQGIDIKIVTDSDNQDREPVKQLIQAGIPIVFDEQNSLMHHKFLIIDHQIVWTGSTNMTESCLFRNRNNSVIFYSDIISKQFETEFLRLYEQKDFSHKIKGTQEEYYTKLGNCDINYYFSPKNGLERILFKRLEKAKISIRIAAFSFTDPKLIGVLKEKIAQGLKVELVLDNRMSQQRNSISHFIDNKNVTIYHGKGKLHHKIIVIDDEIVITGSYNFSKNASDKNNENLVIMNDPKIAELYLKEFKSLY